MKKLSVLILARDEEASLPGLLSDLAPLQAEVLVMDTGSVDRTREIAREAGAKLIDEAWKDDFSVLRNRLAEQATGEWLFYIDADERLPAEEAEKIHALLTRTEEHRAFAVEVLNTCGEGGRPSTSGQIRLVKREAGLTFRGVVYESLLPSVLEKGLTVVRNAFRLVHRGFENAALREAKMGRNRAILERTLAHYPEDPLLRFHYARTLAFFRKREEALLHYRAVIDSVRIRDKQPTVYRLALTALAGEYLEAGRFAEAEGFARQAVGLESGDLTARYVLVRSLFQRGNLQEAYQESRLALKTEPGLSGLEGDLLSVRSGLYGLAVQMLFMLQKNMDAVTLVQEGLNELPMSPDMADVAATAFIRLDRYDDAERIYRQAGIRIPDQTDLFQRKARAVDIIRDRKKEGSGLHPDYLKLIPPGTGSVLVIGSGTGTMGLELKKLGMGRVAALSLPDEEKEGALVRYDQLFDSVSGLLKSGLEFDVALFGEQLNRLHYPDEILPAVRQVLKEKGVALFVVPNIQHYSVLSALGYGLFAYGESGILRRGMRRLFTRREAVRFLEAAGFRPELVQDCVDPLYSQLSGKGVKQLNLGKAVLDLEGLSEEGMREFFSLHFFIRAVKSGSTGEVQSALTSAGKRLLPERVREWTRRGERLIEEKQYGPAAEAFHEALSLDSQSPAALSGLGLVEWYRGAAEDAYYLFKQAAQQAPDDQDILLNMYDAALKTGHQPEAADLLKAALARNPSFSDIRARLA